MNSYLTKLLEKYSVFVTASMNDTAVTVDGKDYPLLPWENERRFIELRALVVNHRIGNLCTYRIGHTATKGTDIFALLKRECGIIEFTANSPITEVFAIAGSSTLNAIVETENGCVCTLELAATLGENERPIDKHEIITDNGIACDMVVDTQVNQSSIFVFGEKKLAFTDVDSELYGCDIATAAKIRNAFDVCKNREKGTYQAAQNARLDKIVTAAKQSIKTLSNVKVSE